MRAALASALCDRGQRAQTRSALLANGPPPPPATEPVLLEGPHVIDPSPDQAQIHPSKARVRCIVDIDGKALACQVLDVSRRDLRLAITSTFNKWRYAPGKVDGVPVPLEQYITVPIDPYGPGALVIKFRGHCRPEPTAPDDHR